MHMIIHKNKATNEKTSGLHTSDEKVAQKIVDILNLELPEYKHWVEPSTL